MQNQAMGPHTQPAEEDDPRDLDTLLLEMTSRLAEILLTHDRGIGYLEATAKVGMVHAAIRIFSADDRRMTHSAIAVTTGIPRHEVARIMRSPELFIEKFRRANRAVRVATQWRQDPFFNPEGTDPPPLLPLTGERSFTTLVRKHSGDIPIVCMLEAMLDAGTVTEEGDDKLLKLHEKTVDEEELQDSRRKLAKLVGLFDL
ncbi:MAG: hypothetical protein RJB26_2262 [Pseudomonadota bacterium]|jgi:hypothetical protein